MNSDSILLLVVLAAFVLFAGDPDLSDAINTRVAGACAYEVNVPAQSQGGAE